jgi:phage terminase large subunit
MSAQPDWRALHNWADPDYSAELARRATILEEIRAGGPQMIQAMRAHYGRDEHAADFIADFAYAFEPRNPERGLSSKVPFIPFPKQRACIAWMLERWRASEPGIVEKCRDAGVSTLAMMVFSYLCIFHQGIAIGIGSALERKVDNAEDSDSLLFKARFFVKCLPPYFRAGFDETNIRLRSHLKMFFPQTSSSIIGEAGNQIGRGGRRSIFGIDEAAHLEQPQLVDSALATTTNVRLDFSSVSGMGTPFARKRFSGKYPVFTFRPSDDPRRSADYLENMRGLHDSATFAQEFLLDYRAGTSGGLIESVWLPSCVGARERLGIAGPSGLRRVSFDPAGEGKNRCAVAARHGTDLVNLHSWSGKDTQSNLYKSLVEAVNHMQDWGYAHDGVLIYDADGLGQSIKELMTEIVNPQRTGDLKPINTMPFFGSAAVEEPESDWVGDGRRNADRYANLKAQCWMYFRRRIERTHLAVTQGLKIDPDEVFSIAPGLAELDDLFAELTQIRYTRNGAGKIVVEKTPSGFTSPDRADAVMVAFAPLNYAFEIWLKCAG